MRLNRYIFILIVSILSLTSAKARHIKGGWIYYQCLGETPNDPLSLRYFITIKVYRDCSTPSPSQNDDPLTLSIYQGLGINVFQSVSIGLTRIETLNKTTYSPCLTSKPTVCYNLLVYETTIDLPKNSAGYSLSYQRCCRIGNIVNLQSPSDNYGNTYSTSIPGTAVDTSFARNNSPLFAQKDTALICYKAPFTLDYSAVDADGDSLVYYFSAGLNGGSQAAPIPNPSDPPSQFFPITYATGYSFQNPFGTNVILNPSTGIITGTAPSTPGEYVVSVSVDEYRNGKKLGTTRKELHVIVAACGLAAAQLKPNYITCDGYTLTFQNEATASSSSIAWYYWNFDSTQRMPTIDTSTNPTPTFTYTDTGKYVLFLKVLSTKGCIDSTSSVVSVYPGFFPKFKVVGSCVNNPYQFLDSTKSKYGSQIDWRWDFGDNTTKSDTSRAQNPQYTYTKSGQYKVQFYVANSKGCSDTLYDTITVLDKPIISLPFKDTLICAIDTLRLFANGTGNFSWQPNINIINPNSSNPLVYPKSDQKYVVTLQTNGCSNTDSVNVQVLPFITVQASPDTSICQTDTIQLFPTSRALSYKWSATDASAILPNNANLKNPFVNPLNTTTFFVTANLGKCQDTAKTTITVYPYPTIKAVKNADSICFGKSINLSVLSDGNRFVWTPALGLSRTDTTFTTASPAKTTTYLIAAYHTTGCPKPRYDSIQVFVAPDIQVNISPNKDSSICLTDLTTLKAIANTAGLQYTWIGKNIVGSNLLDTVQILPDSVRTYIVKANFSFCNVYDTVTITPVPYATVQVNANDSICFGSQKQLQAQFTGTSFNWSPQSSLTNPTSLNPIAGPDSTTYYVFSAINEGCNKWVRDTVVVQVFPQIKVFAGADTSVVLGQILQLNPIVNLSDLKYVWSPVIGIDNPSSKNININLPSFIDSIKYVIKAIDKNGCFGEDDIKVKLFQSNPDILVPSAFTPNKDGLNDIIKPIPIGVTQLFYFNVYNRWGQLLYSTKQIGKGWDGMYNGTEQASGTYIFQTEGIDYLGKKVYKKGSFVLIR